MSSKLGTKNRNDRLSFQIYNQILSIVHNKSLAGTDKLSALGIAEKLGVSRTPVSFVLFRMELEGLISGEEKGGWVVSSLTSQDLSEIFETKKLIFPYIVKCATENISPDNYAKLIIFLDEIDRALKWNDLNSWRAADKGFNRLIGISSGNERLAYFLQVLDNQLYRLLTTYLSMPKLDKSIFLLYQEIASAIGSGKPLEAEEAAKKYVLKLESSLKNFYTNIIIPLLGIENKN